VSDCRCSSLERHPSLEACSKWLRAESARETKVFRTENRAMRKKLGWAKWPER
jgi:hypothetical protein